MARSDDEKKGYAKGYIAGKKDKPEHIVALEERNEYLQELLLERNRTIRRMETQFRILEEKKETDTQNRAFGVFAFIWPLLTDGDTIRKFAQINPDLVHEYNQLKKSRAKDAAQ